MIFKGTGMRSISTIIVATVPWSLFFSLTLVVKLLVKFWSGGSYIYSLHAYVFTKSIFQKGDSHDMDNFLNKNVS